MAPFDRLHDWFSTRFRRLLSGAADGNPPWLDVVAQGEGGGLFLPTDAPWVVHRDFGTLIGGIRALLMQALHPGTLAGVSQHSRYEADPLGRLAGTIRWLTVTTFGSHRAVLNEARRVNRLHDSVAGNYADSSGDTIAYQATDPDLLLWVHLAFMESFLIAHEMFIGANIPRGKAESGADNYVEQWGASVAPLGLDDVPRTRIAMEMSMEDFRRSGVLNVSRDTLDVVRFIQRPPLPVLVRPIYRVLFAAAVASIRPEFREILGLRSTPRWMIVPVARRLLRILRWAVGPSSPIEDAALHRLRRGDLIA